MSHAYHKFWLKITAVIVMSFAPLFFLATMEATAGPARLMVDLIAWPLDGATGWEAHETRFLFALLAGFLLGWGVMIWGLQAWVYDLAPEPVRRVVLSGILAWFVLDSLGSIASGTALNVLANVGILFLAVGPLWRPVPESA